MWYHYLIGLFCLYLLGYGIYQQIIVSYPSWWMRLLGLPILGLYAYGVYWAYTGIRTPVSFIGGRR